MTTKDGRITKKDKPVADILAELEKDVSLLELNSEDVLNGRPDLALYISKKNPETWQRYWNRAKTDKSKSFCCDM